MHRIVRLYFCCIGKYLNHFSYYVEWWYQLFMEHLKTIDKQAPPTKNWFQLLYGGSGINIFKKVSQ